MLDISPDKIVVFLVIAFVVLGPGRLGEVARALGRARAHLRQLTSGLPPDAAKLIRDPRRALLDVLDEPQQVMEDAMGAIKEAIAPTAEHELREDAQ
jgi:Sec-independent protein translocase protein TatA